MGVKTGTSFVGKQFTTVWHKNIRYSFGLSNCILGIFALKLYSELLPRYTDKDVPQSFASDSKNLETTMYITQKLLEYVV